VNEGLRDITGLQTRSGLRGVWAREFRHLTLRSVTGTAQRAIPTEDEIVEL